VCPKKCLHVRPLCLVGPRFREGLRPANAGSRVLPLCAAANAAPSLEFLGRRRVSSAREGHLVDALALRGDEGRGTLRKARGRCERSLIPGSPNGATHPKGYPVLNP